MQSGCFLTMSVLRQKDSNGLRLLYALVRLEGIIDTHGLEMILLSAFPPKFLNTIKKVIDYLRAEEIDLKKKAMWEKNDLFGIYCNDIAQN